MSNRPPLAVLALLVWPGLAGGSPPSGPVEPSGDVPEAKGWRAETMVSGLEHPWGMAWLPDGSIAVTERPGRLRLIRDGHLVPAPIAGVPEVLAQGQGGLLDVAPHPRFAENRLIYLTLAEGTPKANRTALARGRLTYGRLESVELVYRNPDLKSDGQHFGSRLLWLGIADPKVVWTPSKAPSGLAFYSGDRYPGWKGDLFSGALKFGQVRRIDLDGTRILAQEKLTVGARVRDVRQGPDGWLYVLTDEEDGRLLRILPASTHGQ